uniref:Uncharacterized protein n=1 Tax=Candidatus Kentrum sp. FW TaxID=2126338 RepID=A0A450S2G5_9GAMM|nr:MAG: hypothetical protein BECKFW1821A_GA0114235_101120 [Candidatus Kentron sp. FW]
MEKKHVEKHDIGKSPRSKIWESSFLSGIGGLASVVSVLFSVVGDFSSHHLFAAIGIVVAAIFLTVGFTFILSRGERGLSSIGKLKNDLVSAYLNALERSTLNPKGRQP